MESTAFDDVAHRLAARQHGIVTRRQLLDLGVSTDAIDHRVKRGRLRLVHRGVYRVGPVTAPLAHALAACLACGRRAVLSHRSAGVLWAMLDERRSGPMIEVTVPRGVRRRPGLRVYRHGSLHPDETTRHQGIPVTTPARTVLDLSSTLRSVSLERAVGEGLARGLFTHADLDATARRHRGHQGIARMRSVLGGRGPAFTRSEAEARLLTLIRRAGIDPPETNVIVAGHELDFYWPRRRLAVEVDGRAYHSSSRAFERDRRRDAELVGAGIRVMRVTWRQITRESEALLVRLGGALSVTSRAVDG